MSFSGFPSSDPSARDRVRLAAKNERLVAREDPSHDFHGLASSGQRLSIGNAVPAFDDLRTGHPEPEEKAAPAQPVECGGGHRGEGGRSRRDLENRRAEGDALRGSADPREKAHRVRAPRLGDPDRVVAELLRFDRERHRVRIRRRQKAEVQPELHRRARPRAAFAILSFSGAFATFAAGAAFFTTTPIFGQSDATTQFSQSGFLASQTLRP